MPDLPTRYEPSDVEPRVFDRWEASGLFHPEPEGAPEDNFAIAVPPPNVTGALHMGHALNGSVQDTLIRFNRMRGRRAKWILGTDHAGIATQTQVEKALRAEGTSREDIGREAFVERTWEWVRTYGGTIIEEVLLDVMFDLPSRRDVQKCVVTKETIERGISPTLVTVPPEEAASPAAKSA